MIWCGFGGWLVYIFLLCARFHVSYLYLCTRIYRTSFQIWSQNRESHAALSVVKVVGLKSEHEIAVFEYRCFETNTIVQYKSELYSHP